MTATALRLTRLHLASRRVPGSLLALAGLAAALRLVAYWTPAGGSYSVTVPLIVAAAAAALIGVTTRSPIGEPERATGRWLPWLRLGTVLGLTAASCGALALGAVGGHLTIGSLALLRDLAGLTGIALLTAAVLGAGVSWIGPLAYLAVGIFGLQQSVTTPWLWPSRPAYVRGASICAALVFAVGVAAVALRGALESERS